MNGFQLRGIVKGWDPFTVLLEYEEKTHLVYKHAISTVSPGAPVGVLPVDGVAATLQAEPKPIS
jgi:host factor-I protein